tara:strand:- start:78 stop:698 length:621 start_codon:yes stop_codon:yes gene_type:complete
MDKKYKVEYPIRGGSEENIWIFNNFFNDKEFKFIMDNVNKFQLHKDPRSKDRLATCIDIKKYKKFYKTIYDNDKLRSIINDIKNINYEMKELPSYPIEYRKYFTGSKGMMWHIDTSLFIPDAFEIVLTLDNSSDSCFQWIDNNGALQSILPKKNDLVIVRPQTVQHRVTPINVGERTILKFVVEFTENNNNTKKIEFFNEIDKCMF